MARLLTSLERSVFLSQVHPEIAAEIAEIDGNPEAYRYSDLAYPQAGRAVKWPDGSYTLVWRDASRQWWFIDVSSKFAGEVNKPVYASVGSSFLQNVIDETAEMINVKLPEFALDLSGVAVVALVALVLLRK